MLYGVWGIEGILKISIVCFLLSAVMELFIVIPVHRETGKNKISRIVKHDLQESLKFITTEKPIFMKVCVVIAGLNLFLSSMITIGVPVIIVDILDMTDQMLGITQGVFAVGGIFGGLLTAVFEKKLIPCKASFFLYLCAGFTCMMGFGMLLRGNSMFKYIVLTGTGMAVTIASTMFSIQMLAVVQTQTPAYLVGKVIACIMAIIMCAQPIGQLMYVVFFEVFSQHISGIIIGASITLFAALFGSFLIFAVTGKLFSFVDNSLYFSDFAIAFRNTLVLIVLANGIALCSIRIGFIKKSNSITVISAILGSMLLANVVAQINSHFLVVLSIAIVIFLIGIALTFNLARKIEIMEI